MVFVENWGPDEVNAVLALASDLGLDGAGFEVEFVVGARHCGTNDDVWSGFEHLGDLLIRQERFFSLLLKDALIAH